MPHDIVITEFMDEAAVARLRAAHSVLYDTDLADDPDRLAGLLPGVRALIVRNRTQVRGAVLAAGADLTIVGRLGVGLDNIDMAACAERGLHVQPATGANAGAVAEYVVTAALMLRRGAAFRCSAALIAGDWPRQTAIGAEVGGATLGLMGYGVIARRAAGLARGLGMRVIAHDPFLSDSPDETPLVSRETLLTRADILSLHMPLTDQTRGLIDAAAIAAMRPGAILIDTGRGGVVDQSAAAAALSAGHLGGAAFDVFPAEPLKSDAALDFKDVPNLILTPHIAGVTHESNTRVSEMIADCVLEALS